MNKLKKIGIGIVVFFTIFHVTLWATNNLHFYKTLSDTVFKGRLGPSILDYDNYPYRVVKAKSPQVWKLAKNYNQIEISEEIKNQIEELKTTSFVVIHKNKLLYEEYWDGFSDSTYSNSWSMAKSILSMLVGVAITEGKIKSVDEKIHNYLHQYGEGLDAEITIKHLLTMTSGIDFGESYGNPFGFMAKTLYGNDVKDIALQYHASYKPGTIWHYQGGNNLLLSLILRKATGVAPADYLSEKIWQPIGANYNALWSLDKENGYEKSYCCVFSNAKDFARLGKLMLQNGRWGNKTIIDSLYVKNSLKPINIPDRDGQITNQYGYAWWLLKYKNLEVFYARGINGQYILVIPEKELIIVRLGHKRIKEKGTKHPKDVYFYLDAGLEMIE